MLLYAIYTPEEKNSWNHERIYAFASIERFVTGMRLVNEASERKGTMRPVTREEAFQVSSLATLFGDSGPVKDGPLVNINQNGIRDNWDGKWIEIQLTERIEDEKIPSEASYS